MAIRQAQTESSHKSLDRIKTNAHRIAEIAQDCANSFKELSQQKHIELALKTACVLGNKTLFIELLNNIIDNALKYSEQEFNVLIETFTDGERSILQVTDSGPGIPEELRQLVTERFFRASKDTTGSGLGLAIVKEVVLVHHGEMKIMSGKKATGTLIRCSFPLA